MVNRISNVSFGAGKIYVLVCSTKQAIFLFRRTNVYYAGEEVGTGDREAREQAVLCKSD